MDTVLPDRYQVKMKQGFVDLIVERFRVDGAALDIGAGRSPLIPASARAEGMTYAGFDISADELALAGDAYDEKIVGDVCERRPELEDRFDVAFSWHVLEHIRPLQACADNVRTYLKPGGAFISHLPGGLAFFSVANRVLPHSASKRVLSAVTSRKPGTVFPAHYDHCTKSGLETIFRDWSEVTVTPLWRGANYLGRMPHAQRAYLRYEDWAMTKGRTDWAPYFEVVAVR